MGKTNPSISYEWGSHEPIDLTEFNPWDTDQKDVNIVPKSQGNFRCIDGSYAATPQDCPQATLNPYTDDRGWEPDPLIWNPETERYEHKQGDFISGVGEHEDSWLIDIYEAIGGKDWTNLSFEEWKAEYGADFPGWEGSTFEQKTENIESMIGLLEEEKRLTKEGAELKADDLRFTKSSELESMGDSAEAIIRSRGFGQRTGQMQQKADSAYDRIVSGFDFQADANELALEGSLINIEGRRLDYGQDLLDIVENYQGRMWDLITAAKPLQEGPEVIPGCMDPEDPNYNPNANKDDGSCTEVFAGVQGDEVLKNEVMSSCMQAGHSQAECESAGVDWATELYTDLATGSITTETGGEILDTLDESTPGGTVNTLCCSAAKAQSLLHCLGKWGKSYTRCRTRYHNTQCGSC
tara:strand:- start:4245 stop:5471 length:1227 start_codon:yes stop_codon:yes gene_type:complete